MRDIVLIPMFVSRLSAFSERNGLSEECVGELVELFNAALVEVGQGILRDTGKDTVKETVKGVKGVKETVKGVGKGTGEVQRWASKVAESFADEKGLTLDDFPGVMKVTKQHMLDHLKTQRTPTTGTGVKKGSPADSVSSSGKPVKKVQCNGMTNKGEPCTRTGTIVPDGAKNCYCFRHADQWRDFETTVSSDSDSDVDSDNKSDGKSGDEEAVEERANTDELDEEPIED
jgi:hypothetical protein